MGLRGKWVLYIQLNYVHPKPTHLTPLLMYKVHLSKKKLDELNIKIMFMCMLYIIIGKAK